MAKSKKTTKSAESKAENHAVVIALRNSYNQMGLAVQEAKDSALPKSLVSRLENVQRTVGDAALNTIKRIVANEKRQAAAQRAKAIQIERKNKLEKRIAKMQAQLKAMS